jgi:CHAD domain-containing protein
MKHKEIEKIIKERFEKVNVALENVKLRFVEDDIRKFRVKVKKLQSCLNLIGGAESHVPLELPGKMARFYKLSGTIRTLQLQRNHLQITADGKQIALPQTYLTLILNKIDHHIETAAKLISGKCPFVKEQGKLLDLLPHHISTKATQKFIHSEQEKIEKLIAPIFLTDQPIHAIRKVLKNLLYISPYFDMDISSFLPYELLCDADKIDSFSVTLGSFHDLSAAINSLYAECLKVKVDEKEKKVLRNIGSIWVSEREKIRENIYSQLQKIIASGRSTKTLVKWPVIETLIVPI